MVDLQAPLTKDHVGDYNEWEFTPWAGLDGVSRSQWWTSITAVTRPNEADTQLHLL
jgi:hypothetical protein